jgi:hypothetical protein
VSERASEDWEVRTRLENFAFVFVVYARVFYAYDLFVGKETTVFIWKGVAFFLGFLGRRWCEPKFFVSGPEE